MRRLTFEDLQPIRLTPSRSLLLFITDRCPVGCAHCSVDSRRDSPTITDFVLFRDIVDWICLQPDIEVVGISGGEPFSERRGLTLASRRFIEAGKCVVPYTSGVWGASRSTPMWIKEVLQRCSAVFLSTDTFHAAAIKDDRFLRAARAIADEGVWIIVQVIDTPAMVAEAETLLRGAFGEEFHAFAEIRPIPGLSRGRGANVFMSSKHTPGHKFGPCGILASPVVRYDGLTTACCNERVVMGDGPGRLQRQIRTPLELSAAIDGFRSDPALTAIGGIGPGVMTAHPRFSDLADQEFGHVCDLCWSILDRLGDEKESDPLLHAMEAVLAPQAQT